MSWNNSVKQSGEGNKLRSGRQFRVSNVELMMQVSVAEKLDSGNCGSEHEVAVTTLFSKVIKELGSWSCDTSDGVCMAISVSGASLDDSTRSARSRTGAFPLSILGRVELELPRERSSAVVFDFSDGGTRGDEECGSEVRSDVRVGSDDGVGVLKISLHRCSIAGSLFMISSNKVESVGSSGSITSSRMEAIKGCSS